MVGWEEGTIAKNVQIIDVFQNEMSIKGFKMK